MKEASKHFQLKKLLFAIEILKGLYRNENYSIKNR
jgi:hypothetical protein